MPLQPPTVVWVLWIHALNKEGTWDRWMVEDSACWHCSGVVTSRTIKRLPPGERWTGSLLDEAFGSELTPIALEVMAVEMGSERLCCNPTRKLLCHHWCLKFDKCDELHYAELTLRSLDTQTIALHAPTQEQVVTSGGSFRTVSFPHRSKLGDNHRRSRTTGASTRSLCSGRQGTGG